VTKTETTSSTVDIVRGLDVCTVDLPGTTTTPLLARAGALTH
jgi:hypothetical protein